jgi:hypothetical protein
VDEQLVGKAPEVDAETRRQADRREDAGCVRQAADDRFLSRSRESLFLTGHVRSPPA